MNNARIQEVLFKVDILKLVRELSHLTCSGDAWIGLCPFHAEKTPSFMVHPEKQMFYCFGCKAGGSVFTFLMQKERMEFPEAVRTVKGAKDAIGVLLRGRNEG